MSKSMPIPEIRKDWNLESIYDIAGIKEPTEWEYYFTKLFPEYEFTAYLIGRERSSERSRLLFMQRKPALLKTLLLYRDTFEFSYKDGKIELFITQAFSRESRAKIEKEKLAGKDFLAAEISPPDEKNMCKVDFVPKTFEELGMVKAREFTQGEMEAIDNAETQKQIEQKMGEIEELKSKLKPA